MKIFNICMMLACVVWQASAASPDYEAEPRAAPRGILKRGLLARPSGKQSTTTTTTPPPQEEVEYEDEGDYPAEAEPVQNEATSEVPTSTEGKKLVGNGVRPFRSNTDLLEALKRRRMQAAEAKLQGQSPVSTAAVQEVSSEQTPAKSSNYSGKKRFTASRGEANNEDTPAAAKPSRTRFSRPSSRSIQAEPETEEQSNDTAQPPTRSGRNFSRRGGN